MPKISFFPINILNELGNNCTIKASYYINLMIYQVPFWKSWMHGTTAAYVPISTSFCLFCTRSDHFALESKSLCHNRVRLYFQWSDFSMRRDAPSSSQLPFPSSFPRLRKPVPASGSKDGEEERKKKKHVWLQLWNEGLPVSSLLTDRASSHHFVSSEVPYISLAHYWKRKRNKVGRRGFLRCRNMWTISTFLFPPLHSNL